MQDETVRIFQAIDDGAAGVVVKLYDLGFLQKLSGNDRQADLRFYMEKVELEKETVDYWANNF